MTKVGGKALGGEWEMISNYKFEIQEDMTLLFQGRSCNILDSEGNLIEKLGEEHGLVERDVCPGHKCYVMKAQVKFQRKNGY
jgi:hypothetical protein